MQTMTVLCDSFHLFRRHFWAIARLCLPLIVLEAICIQLIDMVTSENSVLAYRLMLPLLFMPLYTAALLLFLDARSLGAKPPDRDLWSTAIRAWPAFIGLMLLSGILLLTGAILLLVPCLWLMVKFSVSQPLLVLRGLGPTAAVRESFAMTRGHFWPVLGCVVGVGIPVMVLVFGSEFIYPWSRSPLSGVVVGSALIFIQLFGAIVEYRLYTELAEAQATPLCA